MSHRRLYYARSIKVQVDCLLYIGSKFIVVPTIIIHSVSIDSTSFMVCPNITVVFMKSVLIFIITIIIFVIILSLRCLSCNYK